MSDRYDYQQDQDPSKTNKNDPFRQFQYLNNSNYRPLTGYYNVKKDNAYHQSDPNRGHKTTIDNNSYKNSQSSQRQSASVFSIVSNWWNKSLDETQFKFGKRKTHTSQQKQKVFQHNYHQIGDANHSYINIKRTRSEVEFQKKRQEQMERQRLIQNQLQQQLQRQREKQMQRQLKMQMQRQRRIEQQRQAEMKIQMALKKEIEKEKQRLDQIQKQKRILIERQKQRNMRKQKELQRQLQKEMQQQLRKTAGYQFKQQNLQKTATQKLQLEFEKELRQQIRKQIQQNNDQKSQYIKQIQKPLQQGQQHSSSSLHSQNIKQQDQLSRERTQLRQQIQRKGQQLRRLLQQNQQLIQKFKKSLIQNELQVVQQKEATITEQIQPPNQPTLVDSQQLNLPVIDKIRGKVGLVGKHLLNGIQIIKQEIQDTQIYVETKKKNDMIDQQYLSPLRAWYRTLPHVMTQAKFSLWSQYSFNQRILFLSVFSTLVGIGSIAGKSKPLRLTRNIIISFGLGGLFIAPQIYYKFLSTTPQINQSN